MIERRLQIVKLPLKGVLLGLQLRRIEAVAVL
jgi:hypothetical protein